MSINDRTNIVGITSLLNSNNINLEQLESDILNDIDDVVEEVDEVENYKKQLDSLGQTLGVSLGDEEEPVINDNDSDVRSVARYEGAGTPRNYNNNDINNMYSNITTHPSKPSFMDKITDEQKKQRILKHVLDGVEGQRFNVDKEKEEDDKAILLEQIDTLFTTLKDDGIDISRVPMVDCNSTIENIENVHKILRLKNDRNRYCSLAEETILAAAYGAEWMFDGEKSYMGKRPDLRGWNATVNVKLRRMRYDTSTFVSEVMQDYHFGPGTRILFELIPSLFLYSKMRKGQYADDIVTSDEMNSAINVIRDINEKSR